MGDGALVEFPSVVDAVECAVAIQQGMEERNADVPDDKRIVLRIGINLGDIIIDGDDIYGDGVNVAARLEAEANPGGVCISDNAYRQVLGKIDLDFEDMGERTLKNIAGTVKVYRWAGGKAVAADNASVTPLPDHPSVAVLPFVNQSGDPEQSFFSDGIAEDLITDLAKLENLFVVSRNNAFAFKDQKIDLAEVGQKLGVAHILKGSVRKAGNRVRINAQLIEAATGGHVWAERYDGALDDIFTLQDEITTKIVAALQVKLTPQEAARPRQRVTDNAEAYEVYLRARSEWHRIDPEGTLAAAQLMREAINIDPGFAAAHAELSGILQQGWSFVYPGFEDDFDEMLAAARRAVELDDGLAQAHARLGWALIFYGRHDEARASFERAVELGPSTQRPISGSPKRSITRAIRRTARKWAHAPSISNPPPTLFSISARDIRIICCATMRERSNYSRARSHVRPGSRCPISCSASSISRWAEPRRRPNNSRSCTTRCRRMSSMSWLAACPIATMNRSAA
jgi:adenylate cyclase